MICWGRHDVSASRLSCIAALRNQQRPGKQQWCPIKIMLLQIIGGHSSFTPTPLPKYISTHLRIRLKSYMRTLDEIVTPVGLLSTWVARNKSHRTISPLTWSRVVLVWWALYSPKYFNQLCLRKLCVYRKLCAYSFLYVFRFVLLFNYGY